MLCTLPRTVTVTVTATLTVTLTWNRARRPTWRLGLCNLEKQSEFVFVIFDWVNGIQLASSSLQLHAFRSFTKIWVTWLIDKDWRIVILRPKKLHSRKNYVFYCHLFVLHTMRKYNWKITETEKLQLQVLNIRQWNAFREALKLYAVA